jgi:hypothetical protein
MRLGELKSAKGCIQILPPLVCTSKNGRFMRNEAG